MKWFTRLLDKQTEKAVRQVAHTQGRRSLIGKLGEGHALLLSC